MILYLTLICSFFQNDVHVNIGGGRDNIVSSNVMYEAERWSMQVDGRGNADNQHNAYHTQKTTRNVVRHVLLYSLKVFGDLNTAYYIK